LKSGRIKRNRILRGALMAVNLNIRFANTDFLAPKVRRAGEAAFEECKEAGYELDWFETWRSLARQEWL
jgi:hypothetical protein